MDFIQEVFVEILNNSEVSVEIKGWDNETLLAAYKDKAALSLQKIKNILEDVALSDFDCIEEILNVYKNLGYIINHRHDFG
ncbi:hypothetical protein [Harryflintia acetispora]|uniref:Uncharacterized protein n=1 Tax=Harryflintia acetispora TaxID=1849041 RepID=A0A9X8ULG1_9FIRM|nr:hypothetical protein [Harryflintia acetispora]TCL45359.1 hypothetical protein EDD78_101342 [Harryflintia acetispora]